MKKLTFGLPAEASRRAHLIDAVPPDWSHVSGTLEAPDSLKALRDTGYRFGRFDEQPRIVGRLVGARESVPDLITLLKGRVPGFVQFGETGYGDREKFARAKRLASSLVGDGFVGQIHFESSANKIGSDKKQHTHPALCEFMLTKQWNLPPHLSLTWNPEFGEPTEQFGTLLHLCKGLTEIKVP